MYLNAVLPAPGFWSAIEHGRKHGGTDEQRAREWQRLKAQGVKTGLADLFIWYRGQFIAPEAKVGDNRPSDAQQRFGAAMHANGFTWFAFWSVVELHDRLVALGVPIAPEMRKLAAHHDATLAAPEPTRPRRSAARPKPKKPTKAAQAFARRAMGVAP